MPGRKPGSPLPRPLLNPSPPDSRNRPRRPVGSKKSPDTVTARGSNRDFAVNIDSHSRPKGQVKLRPADMFNLSLGADLLHNAPLRLILRRVDVSPSVASVLAEHAGLLREARNG